MKRHLRFVLLVPALFSTVAGLFTFPPALIASTAFAEEVTRMETMVVTVSRRPIRLENAPAVVQVITAEDIETLPATSLADLLETQAGIYTDQPGRVGKIPSMNSLLFTKSHGILPTIFYHSFLLPASSNPKALQPLTKPKSIGSALK